MSSYGRTYLSTKLASRFRNIILIDLTWKIPTNGSTRIIFNLNSELKVDKIHLK